MIALDGELVTISKTWNNCVHYGNDNDSTTTVFLGIVQFQNTLKIF